MKWQEFQQNLLLTALESPGLYQLFNTWTWRIETSLFNLSFLDLLHMGLRCQVMGLGSSRESIHLHGSEFPIRAIVLTLVQTPAFNSVSAQNMGGGQAYTKTHFLVYALQSIWDKLTKRAGDWSLLKGSRIPSSMGHECSKQFSL